MTGDGIFGMMRLPAGSLTVRPRKSENTKGKWSSNYHVSGGMFNFEGVWIPRVSLHILEVPLSYHHQCDDDHHVGDKPHG